ncbi:MAG: zf-HC2 domain-containing protein [Candidatus Omnitrophica bacterium]|nr:zf-HC2 domain-containing protein [Candidatus Omnitrophota bacterium]
MDYKRWLSAYVDEQLEPAQRTQLDAHLKTCAACQAELASLKQMLQSLRTMEAPTVPDLLPDIHKQLTSPSFAQRFLAPWPASLPLHGLALAATAAVVLIMVGLPRASHRASLEPPMQLALDKVVSSSDMKSTPQPSQEEQRQYAGSYRSDAVTRLGALSEIEQRAKDYQNKRGADADAGRSAEEKSADAATTLTQNLSATNQYEPYYAHKETSGPTSLEIPSGNEERDTVPADSAGVSFAAIAAGGANVTGEVKQEAKPADAAPIVPEKKKVELPQSVPTLLQVQWKIESLQEAGARVSEWVSAQGGFAIATNDHHLSVKLPPTQVQAFLQQFSSDSSLQAPPASPQALWVTISLELVLSE